MDREQEEKAWLLWALSSAPMTKLQMGRQGDPIKTSPTIENTQLKYAQCMREWHDEGGEKRTQAAQNPSPVAEDLERRLETKIIPFFRWEMFNDIDDRTTMIGQKYLMTYKDCPPLRRECCDRAVSMTGLCLQQDYFYEGTTYTTGVLSQDYIYDTTTSATGLRL